MSDDPRRLIPGVDRLLEQERAAALIQRFGRAPVTEAVREVLAWARTAAEEGKGRDLADPAPYLAQAEALLAAAARPSLRRVVNATGVILHTNLGRAPLAAEARTAMSEAATGYSNLEFDLEEGSRGSRYVHCAALLAELTGAQSGLVVNNCAASLVLALNTLAAGRAVVVSRGELVEIGGGFRIPEMLTRAGARLREVGSTNRTRVEDYRQALDEGDVGAILKVHRSNFRVSGFTEEASPTDLVALGADAGIPVVHDVGSGLLVDPASLGLPPEPRPVESVAAGATLALFSGDKLLGGPQAGLVVGREDTVARLRTNPLCRALRVDKGTLAALEATLRLYRDPDTVRSRVPVLRMLSEPASAVRRRAEALAERLGRDVEVAVAPGNAVVGGGTFPGHAVPSWTLRIASPMGAETLAARLRHGNPPVVARVEDGRVVLDLRTVASDEEDLVQTGLLRALAASAS